MFFDVHSVYSNHEEITCTRVDVDSRRARAEPGNGRPSRRLATLARARVTRDSGRDSRTIMSGGSSAANAAHDAMRAAIGEMDASRGFDAVVVCTSNAAQEAYWQRRLELTRGQAAKEGATIVCVHEDWAKDGAGNGLGTLYAYEKARAKARETGRGDLDEILANGGTIGMYHTAGKGTRLAPLPGSENNNKPGVKLPSLVTVDGGKENLTILEAVIRQTGRYASERAGRCSVFWGDQIFVPAAGHGASGKHHADILAFMGPMPTAEEWRERGLEKYGLIAVNEANEATQVEKVSYDTAAELLKSFGSVAGVGPSLGSFSLSAPLLSGLLEEFKTEIAGKTAKFDSDPHFWMPLTLSKDAYVKVMSTKGEAEEQSSSHHDRMQAFRAKLLAAHPDKGMFGAINVGEGSYWWDYGLLALYMKNNLLALGDSEEAKSLRLYLGIPEGARRVDAQLGATKVDESTVVLASKIDAGHVASSVVSHVCTKNADISNSLLVNVTAKNIRAHNCVVYNVVDESDEGLILPDGAVFTNVFIPAKGSDDKHTKLVMSSTTATCGGKVFKSKLSQNPYSFNQVYELNADTDVERAYAAAKAAHAEAAAKH